MLLSAYNEWTKRSGYYRVRSGRAPEALIFDDRMIGGPDWVSNGVPFLRKGLKATKPIL